MVNLCGEVFMDNVVRSPFECMSEILNRTLADLWFVDFHGETTGEKETFAQVFADRCVMIVGTHTHVQTADEQLMRGCAYISDAGMCGAFDSILGRDKREVIERTLYQIKTRYTVAEGPAMLCGVWAEIEGRILHIYSGEERRRLSVKDVMALYESEHAALSDRTILGR